MAYNTTEFDSGFGRVTLNILGSIRGFFAAIGSALVQSSAYTGRVRQVEALQAKTDEELAAMKIKREDIVQHVFHDLFYI
ncbi:hypothetical protein [Roseobacter sp.]|uniref:hypothetical protein n=1 Tax=Roseobacter sp. TaxID=1907202 RepID=UPI003296A517